ncbi:MAG: hypothetical protein HY905_00430, partial [Deltaproteobacteria bacterium]|nr:hypothetical protein [Deltaproteobacteria bacterium]
IVMDAAGGGGYGDPLSRDPESVAADVADGLVGLESARDDYAVVLDPVTLRVDLPATETLRRARLSMIGHSSTLPPR